MDKGTGWGPRPGEGETEKSLLDLFKEAHAREEENTRSMIRRKSVQDPMWAAKQIIELMEDNARLREELLTWEHNYWGTRPRGL